MLRSCTLSLGVSATHSILQTLWLLYFWPFFGWTPMKTLNSQAAAEGYFYVWWFLHTWLPFRLPQFYLGFLTGHAIKLIPLDSVQEKRLASIVDTGILLLVGLMVMSIVRPRPELYAIAAPLSMLSDVPLALFMFAACRLPSSMSYGVRICASLSWLSQYAWPLSAVHPIFIVLTRWQNSPRGINLQMYGSCGEFNWSSLIQWLGAIAVVTFVVERMVQTPLVAAVRTRLKRSSEGGYQRLDGDDIV
jgi:hypothetical protein